MSKEFEVGDEVCVNSHYGPSTRKLTVTRKLKRYVECNDGTKWHFNGQRYGGSRDVWSTSSLSYWGEKNDKALLMLRVKHLWGNELKKLSYDQLERIESILKEPT